MSDVIHCGDSFKPEFRKSIVELVKSRGAKATEKILIDSGFSVSFSKALIKSIMRKEGW